MNPPDWAIRTAADRLALSQGAYWNPTEAGKVVLFAEAFYRPSKTKDRFRLWPFQRRFLMSLYGWRWPGNRRRWRFANLHISKKNSKTCLVSILSMYELFGSGEASPTVYAAAASLANAEQIFNELKFNIEGGPFKDICDIENFKKRIRVPSLNGLYRTYASRGKSVHGDPANLVVLDECAVHGDPELFHALRYNIDSSPNGLCVAISTAGRDVNHWYHSTYLKSKRILSGEDLDTIHYAEVYEADKDSDFEKDSKQWMRANPSIGCPGGLDLLSFEREVQSAKPNLGEWLNFQRLKLNIWVRPEETAWLDVTDFDRYKKDIPDEELLKFDCVCSADLSETTDPSSVSLVFDLGEVDGKHNYYVKSWAWVCRHAIELRKKTSLPLFDEFVAQGHMHITDGDLIDRDSIKDHILDLCGKYRVRQVNFDPASAYIMMSLIEAEGHRVGRFIHSPKNFNTPMMEFSRAWKEGRVWHDGSTWLRYTLSNVRVQVNRYGEIAPLKRISADAIDGAVATLLGFVSIFQPDATITTGILHL